MKFFIHMFILLFLTSCTSKNAFTDFELTKNQELSIKSLKRTKITKDGNTEGAFSAVYLNEIYPNVYKDKEYFLVYLYLKNNEELNIKNTNNDAKNVNISLNNIEPIEVKELPSKNEFSELTNTTNKWNRYYLVSFDKMGENLILKIESDQSFSAVLAYQKDQ